jgi:uncharacterized protein
MLDRLRPTSFAILGVLSLGCVALYGCAYVQRLPEERPESTPLMLAAVNGNLERVDLFLKEGADPNARDKNGRTALMYAGSWTTYHSVMGGKEGRHVEIIDRLLKVGAQIDARSDDGMTALTYATAWGHPTIAKALIDRGADVNIRDKDGRSALTWAASWGRDDESLVKPLLKKGAAVSFIDALLLKDADRVRSLVPTAKPGDLGPHDETALMVAAQMGYAEVVQSLLAKGYDANARDRDGCTALIYALGGRPALGQMGYLWVSKGPDLDRTPVVKTLLDHKADVNARTNEGDTTLYWAVDQRMENVARLLIERGADVNVMNGRRGTPLGQAVGKGNVRLVKMLLERGADPNKADDFYGLPLVRAAGRKADTEVMRVLIAGGADVNKRLGRTPLMETAHEGTPEAVRFLVSNGAKVNLADSEGLTALMFAAGRNTPDVVQALISAGADHTLRNNDRQTALGVALSRDRRDNAEVLRKAGAKE